jgi:hypothetical protein
MNYDDRDFWGGVVGAAIVLAVICGVVLASLGVKL